MRLPAPRRIGTLVGALLLFGILSRVISLLQNASLSGDEAMLALNVGRRSFGELLLPLDFSQIAPVPFLWAERLATLLFGVSGTVLRLVPLAAGITLLWVLYRLAAAVGDQVESIVALALGVTAYRLIRYSVEVKPYIVDALVAAALVLLAIRLAQDLDDRRSWVWLALGGVVGVLLSTPAILVGGAVLAGIAVACLRARRPGLLLRLGLMGLIWSMVFAAAYLTWYAPVVGTPYMRDFWAEALIRPGTAHFFRRLWIGLDDTACTLTCWRGIFDLAPLLLLLVAVGVTVIWRRQGPEYAIMLNWTDLRRLWCVHARTLSDRRPIDAVCRSAAGGLGSGWDRGRGPKHRGALASVKTRWPVALFLYPSLVLAAVLTFAPPADWGVRGVEIGPLADVFLRDGGGEPVYIFARAIPAWVFHTTNWADPDTARLAWVARNGGPDGGAFVNGPSRGTRPRGEGRGLVYLRGGRTELFGTRAAPKNGGLGPAAHSVWFRLGGERSLADALRSPPLRVARDVRFRPPASGRAGALLSAVRVQGGGLVSTREAPGAVLYRIRFGSRSPD